MDRAQGHSSRQRYYKTTAAGDREAYRSGNELLERLRRSVGAARAQGEARRRQRAVFQRPFLGRCAICGARAGDGSAGFAKDIKDAGLLKIFASRAIEDKWIDELFELNRGQGGNPGKTKDAQALVRSPRRSRSGSAKAWRRSIAKAPGCVPIPAISRAPRTMPIAIRRAGQEKWIADTMPRLDLRRTFGTKRSAGGARRVARMFVPMAQGDHFDYGRPIEEPLYPTSASTASAARELHSKTGKDWRDYNEKYGVHNATHTVVEAMLDRGSPHRADEGVRHSAARGLSKTTSAPAAQPAETADQGVVGKIGALEQAYKSAAADAAARARIAAAYGRAAPGDCGSPPANSTTSKLATGAR